VSASHFTQFGQDCAGKERRQGILDRGRRLRVTVVLRGLVPRIHVFGSRARRRGWPGLARPRRQTAPILVIFATRDFSRIALRSRGRGREGPAARHSPPGPPVIAGNLQALTFPLCPFWSCCGPQSTMRIWQFCVAIRAEVGSRAPRRFRMGELPALSGLVSVLSYGKPKPLTEQDRRVCRNS
jgi:hypothetical protein